jgi:glycerol-3-phosphate dehydrogenase
MRRSFGALEDEVFDLLVIGGGIFGACAAWDATLRGLSVALVEREDFCSGASANSFKVVHGGIRYLQHLDLVRLRGSSNERAAWLRIAPHLVSPVPIVIPTYGHGREGKLVLRAGMLVYDLCTFDRNRGLRDGRQRVPWSGFLSAADVERLFPGVRSDRLTGGAVFYDGQMYNPTRLALAFVRGAVDRGALAVNYAEVTRLIRSADAVVGAEVRDQTTGEVAEVRARAVLNAGGPWVPWLNEPSGLAGGRDGTFSRDACFLVRRRFPHPYGIAVQGSTRDPDAVLSRSARHLFLLPWRQYTLCGVWHVVWKTRPDTVQVPVADLDRFIEEMNGAFPGLALGRDDVTLWNAGLVPFGENEPGAENLSYGHRSHVVDHRATDGVSNLVSLIGIRYTMARGDAAKAVDLICAKLGKTGGRAATDRTPVDGGDFDRFDELLEQIAAAAPPLDRDVVEALAHNHGAKHTRVLSLLREAPEWGERLGDSTTLKAEVVNAIREEMAVRLADVVFRRTDLATGGHPGEAALAEAAALTARELSWDDARQAAELAAVEQRLRPFSASAAHAAPARETATRTLAEGISRA